MQLFEVLPTTFWIAEKILVNIFLPKYQHVLNLPSGFGFSRVISFGNFN